MQVDYKMYQDRYLIFFAFVCSPEGLGVVSGAMYLMCLFLFIPLPFLSIWFEKGDYDFPHHEVITNFCPLNDSYDIVSITDIYPIFLCCTKKLFACMF